LGAAGGHDRENSRGPPDRSRSDQNRRLEPTLRPSIFIETRNTTAVAVIDTNSDGRELEHTFYLHDGIARQEQGVKFWRAVPVVFVARVAQGWPPPWQQCPIGSPRRKGLPLWEGTDLAQGGAG
jgi:hypothetical protein